MTVSTDESDRKLDFSWLLALWPLSRLRAYMKCLSPIALFLLISVSAPLCFTSTLAAAPHDEFAQIDSIKDPEANHVEPQAYLLTPDFFKNDITDHICFFDNTELQLDLESLLSKNGGAYFNQSNESFLSSVDVGSRYWLKVKLKGGENESGINWFLTFSQSFFESLDLYFVKNGSLVDHRFRKDLEHKSDAVIYPNPTFDFYLKPGEEVTLYIDVVSTGKLNTTLAIFSADNFVLHASLTSLAAGIFYGALAIMLIYNFFIYINIRELAYLYYSLYVLMCGIYFIGVDSIARQYLGYESFFNSNFSQGSSCILLFAFYLLFLHKLLNLKAYFPRMGNLYRVYFLYIFVSMICFSVLSGYILFVLTYVALLGYAILSLYPLITLSLRRNQTAIIILIAYVLPIFSGSFYIWNDLGLFSFEPDSIGFMIKLGFVSEFAILSFALANRFNSIRKRNFDLQKQAISNLQSSDRLKREFLATISHEFRTPMNGVQGSLELMGHAKKMEELPSLLKIANESSQHMMSLIDSILEFVQLDTANPEANNCDFTIEEIVEYCVKESEENCKYKSLEFVVKSSVPVKIFHADSIKIQQVLRHLLNNAIKFTANGFVKLEISANKPHEGATYGELEFSVADSGIGIAQSKQDEIFKLFKQADGSFSRRFGGLGIGLTVASKLVSVMGGSLWCESIEGEGSVFTFTVPVDVPAQIDPEQLINASIERLNRDKLDLPISGKPENSLMLVVEDNLVNQAVLKALLEKIGYRVETCENGRDAVDWCEHNTASIIFMDCQMPVMDGFEATECIRMGTTNNKNVPIIAVTANVSDADREHCHSSGMVDFLMKPISKSVIEEVIHKWIT